MHDVFVAVGSHSKYWRAHFESRTCVMLGKKQTWKQLGMNAQKQINNCVVQHEMRATCSEVKEYAQH
eukprot:7849066-Karenia_brevis.AAC.1